MVRRLSSEYDPWTARWHPYCWVWRRMLRAIVWPRLRLCVKGSLAPRRRTRSCTRAGTLPIGRALGGDEGRALIAQATEALTAEGVRNPARWVACHMPGEWASTAKGTARM